MGVQTEGRICQSSIISSNHVGIWLSMQDGCVGNGGYSQAAATASQTRQFRFVALSMSSGKDISGRSLLSPHDETTAV